MYHFPIFTAPVLVLSSNYSLSIATEAEAIIHWASNKDCGFKYAVMFNVQKWGFLVVIKEIYYKAVT